MRANLLKLLTVSMVRITVKAASFIFYIQKLIEFLIRIRLFQQMIFFVEKFKRFLN